MISEWSNSRVPGSSVSRKGMGLFIILILLLGLSKSMEAFGIEPESDFRGTIQGEESSAAMPRSREDQSLPEETINGKSGVRGPIESGASKAASSRSEFKEEQRGSVNGGDFYLTDTNYSASGALTACAVGFHMASLWELLDVSNLVYAANQPDAYTRPDSGQGPPSDWNGWVRTGGVSSSSNSAGTGNCSAWTSASGAAYGTAVKLDNDWSSSPTRVGPWVAGSFQCSLSGPVWCVAD